MTFCNSNRSSTSSSVRNFSISLVIWYSVYLRVFFRNFLSSFEVWEVKTKCHELWSSFSLCPLWACYKNPHVSWDNGFFLLHASLKWGPVFASAWTKSPAWWIDKDLFRWGETAYIVSLELVCNFLSEDSEKPPASVCLSTSLPNIPW